MENNILPDKRRSLLKTKIKEKGFIRIIEVHNGLSALIAEKTQIKKKNEFIEYDGFWESSLTDAASKGMPDAEIIGYESRFHTIDEILNITAKPIVVDGDTGGSPSQFEYLVKKLGRLGVSAVIIEDKIFPKRNSLDSSAKQILEKTEKFSQKIKRGNDVKISDDFMIIARIESFIAGVGLDDAIKRAEIYINAGVDGIMIHSKNSIPDEILAFAREYNKLCKRIGKRPPLVSVPTTYNFIKDQELADNGFNIIIHANHLLRAAHKAMKQTAETILLHDRNFEVEPTCSSVKEIFREVGFDWIKSQDKKYSKEQKISVVIPAAGKDSNFEDMPKTLSKICGKTILERQLENIRKIGFSNIAIVRGYKGEMIDYNNIKYYKNPEYNKKHSLHSLFCARQSMDNGFVLLYSDILFNEEIFRLLIENEEDIILLVDNSYRYHKHDVDKKLDLVVGKLKQSYHYRMLQPSNVIDLAKIGKNIDRGDADFEFIGIAYFSEKGAEILKKVYDDCKENYIEGSKFQEAKTFHQASITDIIQEIIDRGFKVNALQVYKGWIEIHSKKDKKIAEKMISSLT
ncbi:MAG: phosphoenolpyruvate mutase [Thermoplasmatales archaeon]|nr:MAG: phosphoenolpyruvate mutase [Thermoplasmatales archaeon]